MGRNRGGIFLMFVVYVLFGLYALNRQLNFVEISENFVVADGWILFVAGLLLIFAGIKFIMNLRRPVY